MDLDELFPKKSGDPLAELIRQDLDPLSVDELRARIVVLQSEIDRVQAKIDASIDFRASAEAIFKK